MALAPHASAQTPTDPVAWLKAENNATDATANGNNGVVNGTVSYVAGKVGSAFNFTGNVANYIRIPNSASLQSSLLSVEYWVNFNSATNAVTVAKRNGSSDAWQAGIVYISNESAFKLQFVGNTSGGLFDWYSGQISSPVGVWTHVAITYDGTTVKGYINGTQVLTQAVTLQLSSRTADIYVGNYAGTLLPLDAKLDELSIYNRALSAAEVLSIFQAGTAGKTPPAPTLTSISPISGSTAGGTNVTLTGTNFTGATGVTFGGTAATSVTVVNSTSITATTPARTAGTASVIVTTPGGSNAANTLYTYISPAPTLTSISPSIGTTSGGTTVTLTGTNFTGATEVTFGGNAATSVTVVNATTLTATTPAGSAGTASVIVTTPGGSNAANSLYTYVSPVVAANFTSASTVPISAASYTATGRTLDLTLGFAPATGTTLTVVNNTGLGFISGTFANLAHGQAVALSFGGVTYNFVANYYGGTGNDLVLVWANTRVAVWGGPQSRVPTNLPTDDVLSGKTIVAVASGSNHHLALCADGTVAAWGANSWGQLGDSTFSHSFTDPVAVTTTGALAGKTVIAVSAGNTHSLALCADGTIVSWGANDSGQLGNPSVSYSGAPIAVSTSGALSGKTVVAISAGSLHNLALCSDGTVVAWGSNTGGVLGNSSNASSNVPVAVTTTGLLTGKTVVAISAGSGHSMALCSDGTLAVWGSNNYGQLGNTTVTFANAPIAVNTDGVLSGRTVTAISAGGLHSLARCSDGTLVAWGLNDEGRVGDGSTTRRDLPVVVTSGGALASKTVASLSSGDIHNLALCTDGTLIVWGGNYNRQLGDGGTDHSLVPLALATGMPPGGGRFVGAKSGPSSSATLVMIAAGAPTVTAVTPFSGVTTGGTSVTITGTDFTGATGVTFGGTAATNVTVVNDTTITATTPAGATGAISVIVTTPRGSNPANSLYTYVLPEVVANPPALTGVSPASGSTYGGTSVTITGSDFTNATALTFGGTSAATFSVVNDTTITAVTPAHAEGAVSIVVTTPAGSDSANSAFTFVTPPAPTVTGVSPTNGPRLGGTGVTITGTDFDGATSVTFGGVAASFTVVNVTTITATAPANAVGAASVVVTTPSGSNSANSLYTYLPVAPTITGISPTSGVNIGGTTVTLTGTDFTGATSVKFGNDEVSSFTVVDSTTITVVTPWGAAGATSVVVTTPRGSNAVNSLYTYYNQTLTNTQIGSSQPTSSFLTPPTFNVSVSTLGGAPVPGKIALFIDDVLLERKSVDSSGWAYFTPTPSQLRGGTHTVRAVYNDDLALPDYASSSASPISQVVNKSALSISLDSATLTQTYDGNSHPVTATVGTLPSSHTESGVQVNITYNGGATAPTNAGTYPVVATIDDPSLSGTASGTLTINKATATYTFQNLVFAYDGQPHPAVVTTTPSVPVTVTYDRLVNNVPAGSPTSTAPTNNGNYKVIVTNPNYILTPSTTNPLTITARGVFVSIGRLEAVPDGTPQAVTITTNPPGISVAVTYQFPNDIPRSTPPQFTPGTSGVVYVEATVNQAGYEGKATGYMNYSPKAALAISLAGPATAQPAGPQTYTVTLTGRTNGRDRSGMVTLLRGTEVVGSGWLQDTYENVGTVTSVRLEPSATPHAITARYEGNAFYAPATSNTVNTTIAKSPLTLTPTSPLTVTYDGRAKTVSFKGPGTPAVPVEFDVTYDNSTTLPVNATTTPVQVRAIIRPSDPRYFGTTTVPLTINKAPATIALGSLTQPFDGTPRPVSVITTPAGVATSVNYGGGINPTPPSAVGSHFVSAVVSDPNYTAASVIGTLAITSGSVRIDISDTTQNYTLGKSSYPVTVATTPPVAYSVTYNGVSYDVPGEKRGPYGAGTYEAMVTITQPGYSGTASATLTVKPLITVNHPRIAIYGDTATNQGSIANGQSVVNESPVSPSTPFTFVEGSKLRFIESVENELRYRFVKWQDGNTSQERVIDANTRVFTPIVRPEIKLLYEAYTKINGVEQKSAVGGTLVPMTNGRTYAFEKEVVTYLALPSAGYVVDRWEHHDFSSNPRPVVYSLRNFSHQYGTEVQELNQGFTPVKVYFTKGYSATSAVNVLEAGSVQLVREDGYGLDANGTVIGRVDARLPNAVIPEGINTVAKAVPAEGYLFNTWILEGAVPANLPSAFPFSPDYNAALIQPTITVAPIAGATRIKLTAVFVRKVAAPVASFTRLNTLNFGLGLADVSVARNPILKIANEGTAPLVNARITGVEISGARMKLQSNEVEELNTGGFYEFYLQPFFRPLTPEEVANPDPYFLRFTEYGPLMIAQKPLLTAPNTPITDSAPIIIGTLNPGQDKEFNDLQYHWVKTDLALGAPIGGVSFSFLQYRVTVWITADGFPATPVSFWTN